MRFQRFYPFLVLIFAAGLAWAKPEAFSNLKMGAPVDETIAVPKNIRSFFDSKIESLQASLKTTKDPQAKVSLLKKSLNEIQTYRDGQEMSDVDDEVYMDIVTKSLLDLPEASQFQINKCGFYKKSLLLDYEPTATQEDGPEDPAVVKAVEILRTICS